MIKPGILSLRSIAYPLPKTTLITITIAKKSFIYHDLSRIDCKTQFQKSQPKRKLTPQIRWNNHSRGSGLEQNDDQKIATTNEETKKYAREQAAQENRDMV